MQNCLISLCSDSYKTIQIALYFWFDLFVGTNNWHFLWDQFTNWMVIKLFWLFSTKYIWEQHWTDISQNMISHNPGLRCSVPTLWWRCFCSSNRHCNYYSRWSSIRVSRLFRSVTASKLQIDWFVSAKIYDKDNKLKHPAGTSQISD